MTATTWTLRRRDTLAIDTHLHDVQMTDAFNRFARHATVIIEDPDGDKLDTYNEELPVDLLVQRDIDPAAVERFSGYVVNPRAQDHLVVLEVHSFDQWLRRRTVFETYTAQLISYVLQDLVTKYTGLTWDPESVTIANDVPVTRTWKGETLDECIAELASISGDEEFGADRKRDVMAQLVWGEQGPGAMGDPSAGGGDWGDNALLDAIVFYFHPTAERRAPRQLTDGQFYHSGAVFQEDAKRQVNRVTLFYGAVGSTSSVTVQDLDKQKQLQDQLAAARPVVVEISATYPEITNQTAALRKARQMLDERTVVRIGEVDTWEMFDAYPGDIARVEYPDRGIAADFRIAELTYNWRDDTTHVKLAENKPGVLDILVSMSNDLARQDARDADPAAQGLQVVDIKLPIALSQQIQIALYPVPAGSFYWGDQDRGAWGDTAIGGGVWGDNRGAPTLVESEF